MSCSIPGLPPAGRGPPRAGQARSRQRWRRSADPCSVGCFWSVFSRKQTSLPPVDEARRAGTGGPAGDEAAGRMPEGMFVSAAACRGFSRKQTSLPPVGEAGPAGAGMGGPAGDEVACRLPRGMFVSAAACHGFSRKQTSLPPVDDGRRAGTGGPAGDEVACRLPRGMFVSTAACRGFSRKQTSFRPVDEARPAGAGVAGPAGNGVLSGAPRRRRGCVRVPVHGRHASSYDEGIIEQGF
jgi:hypothetical protein